MVFFRARELPNRTCVFRSTPSQEQIQTDTPSSYLWNYIYCNISYIFIYNYNYNALFSLPFKSLFKAQMSQTAGSRVYVSLNVKQSCHCLLRQLGPFLPAALRGLRGRCSASQDQFESDLRGLTVSRKSCCLGVGTWTEPFCTGAAAGLIQHSKNSLWMLYACHPFTRASPAGPCWWLAHSLNCEPKNRGWYCTFQKDVLSKE